MYTYDAFFPVVVNGEVTAIKDVATMMSATPPPPPPFPSRPPLVSHSFLDYVRAVALLTVPTIVVFSVVFVCVYLCLVRPARREQSVARCGTVNTVAYIKERRVGRNASKQALRGEATRLHAKLLLHLAIVHHHFSKLFVADIPAPICIYTIVL